MSGRALVVAGGVPRGSVGGVVASVVWRGVRALASVALLGWLARSALAARRGRGAPMTTAHAAATASAAAGDGSSSRGALGESEARFVCSKCGTTSYSTSEIRTCSNAIARILNVQNRRFLTVTCSGCGHTQMFETSQSFIAHVLDVVVR